MKYFFLLLFITLLIFGCTKSEVITNASDGSSLNDNSKKELVEKLLSTEWGPNFHEADMFIKFLPNGKIKTHVNYEGGDYLIGSYIVRDDSVILTISDNSGLVGFTQEERILKLHEVSNSYHFIEYLEEVTANKYKPRYWNQSLIQKDGVIANVDDYKVEIKYVKCKMKPGSAFYENPDDNSRKYTISLFDGESTFPDFIYLNEAVISVFANEDVIGVLASNTDWLCIGIPIQKGDYSSMFLEKKNDLKLNYCWVKAIDVIL